MLEVYLFSLLDGFKGLFVTLAFISGVGGMILFIIGGAELSSSKVHQELKLSKDEAINAQRLFDWIKPCVVIFIISLPLSVFIPSQNALVKSYLILEGKDLATSENVELILEKLDEKSDKFIENMEKK